MFSISLIFLCILTINNQCRAEEEENLLFSTTNELNDPSIFSPDSSWLLDPGDFEKGITSQTDHDLTDLTSNLSFLNDDANNDEIAGGTLPVFADGAGASCSNGLSRRGAGNNACDNLDQDDSRSSSSGLNPASIDPKVAPYIDLQTMQLKRICARTPEIPYSIPVCSSGTTGEIVMHPPKITFELLWAEKIFTVTDLLACYVPRYIFCCRAYRDDVYQTSLGAWIQNKGQGYACDLLDPFDYFYMQDQIKMEF